MRKLAVTGLHKAFGSHPVLTGLDLAVPAGSFTAILGPSGSGKTTLLAVLSGLLRPDSGRVLALGQELWAMSDHDRERFRLRPEASGAS